MYFVLYFISSFFHFLYFIFLSQLRKLVIPRLQTRCRRGNKHFDVHLRWIRTVHFLSKDGKGASYDGRDGWKSCLFPARVGKFDFDVIMYKVLFPICTLTWRVNKYVSRQGEGINRRNESTKNTSLLTFSSTDDNIQYFWFPSLY